MKHRLTTIDIIVAWLRTHTGRVIGSYEIETAVPKYAMLFHQHAVTPGTINRKFRLLRQSPELQLQYGITIREQPPHGKESKWLVTPFTITKSPLAQSPTEQSSSQSVNSVAA